MNRWTQTEILEIADRVWGLHERNMRPSECINIAKKYCSLEQSMHRLAEAMCSEPEKRPGQHESLRVQYESKAYKWAINLARSTGKVVRYHFEWDPRGVAFVVEGLAGFFVAQECSEAKP